MTAGQEGCVAFMAVGECGKRALLYRAGAAIAAVRRHRPPVLVGDRLRVNEFQSAWQPGAPDAHIRKSGCHWREVLARPLDPVNATLRPGYGSLFLQPHFAALREREDVRAPRWLVQVESPRLQVVAVPLVGGVTEQILSRHCAVAEVCKRQPHVALALVGRVVHRHQQPLATGALPGKGQEAIPRPVALPGRSALEQLPFAVAHAGWRSTASSRS